MTSPSSPEILLTHLQWSLQRLEEALKQENTEYYRDTALQRFGFTYDLALKCIRAFAAQHADSCETARQCFELAAARFWLDKDSDWAAMVESYDRMTPAPPAEIAVRIYERLDSYRVLLEGLHRNLTK